MGNPKSEMAVVEEARGLVAASERREALDAALDITATTTKLKAKQAVADATDALSKAATAHKAADAAVDAALLEYGKRVLYTLPLTQKIRDVVKTLTDETVTADEVWCDIRVGRNEEGLWVRGSTILEFEIERRSTHKTQTISPGEFECELDISRKPDIRKLMAAEATAKSAREKAQAVYELAKARLNNHGNLVDMARVQLQRGKLAQMGQVGEQVLERIDNLLEASAGGENYLALL